MSDDMRRIDPAEVARAIRAKADREWESDPDGAWSDLYPSERDVYLAQAFEQIERGDA